MILFAGPSLNQLSKSLIDRAQIALRPPIKRGDIKNLGESGNPKHIIIVDGVFHQARSVGHKEIRDALNHNIDIWGLSSMGAIRAYEMRFLGMKGFGSIYDRFFQESDFQDDELALLHGPGPQYLKLSEPLVHMRICIEDLVIKNRILHLQGNRIIEILKKRYFGERTMNLFSEVTKEITGIDLEQLVPDFTRYRQKEADLVQFIQEKKWLHG